MSQDSKGAPGAVLRADNLSKRYKKRIVIKDFSMSIRQGEIVGLLGPNGCGKTTSFYMVLGIIKCDRGTINLDGRDITKLKINERAQLGLSYLPQENSIFRRLSVEDNIMAILELNHSLNATQRKERLEKLLEEFSITHIRKSLGMSLSGGERRRTEIARTLATNPRFVLLDEPFAGVDPVSVQEINLLIRSLSDRGIGVFITDHNVRETLSICQRAYILSDGQVLTSGDAETILNNPQVRQVYLGKDFQF